MLGQALELTFIGMVWVFAFLALLIALLVAMRPLALLVAQRDMSDEERAVAAIVAWERDREGRER